MLPLLTLVLSASPLSFDDALSLSARAPLVTASERAVVGRKEAASKVGSLQANPTLGVQPGLRTSALGTGPEVIGTLSQPFNVSGYGSARREALDRASSPTSRWARGSRRTSPGSPPPRRG